MYHGRPTCDMCGTKLKKSSKHHCALLDTLEDYPALDSVSESESVYDVDVDEYEPRSFEENQAIALYLSSLGVAGHEQEPQDAERYYGYSDYDTGLYYDSDDPYTAYNGSESADYECEDVQIYESDSPFGNDSDEYEHPDYRYEYKTKVASPVPLPVYLSQALTKLIERFGDVMPCYEYEDDSEDDTDSSSGSDRTLNEDVSDRECDAQVLEKEAVWTFGEWANDPKVCDEEAHVV